MKEIKLKVRIREGSGKKSAHTLRRQGEIPGILYGHKEEPVKLALPEHDFWTILHNATSEHLILSVDVAEGGSGGKVLTLVRDVQHDPVTGDILHVDLQRISRDEEIKVGVPVILTGTARGVKEFGGILDHGVREVVISTTPESVPEHLEVDISHLEIGQTVHVSDIMEKYQEIIFVDDASITLAHVSPPKKLEVAAVEEAEAEAAEGEGEGEEGEEKAEEDGGES